MRKIVVLATLVLSFSLSVSAVSAGVLYPDFSSTSGLKLNGDARQFRPARALRLVRGPGENGTAFTTDKVLDTGKSFRTRFKLNAGYANGPVGDGMAFVVSGDKANALGAGGSGLGYDGIHPSLVVEFDIFENPEANDPGGNHVAIMRNGDSTTHLASKNPSVNLFGQDVFVWVRYLAEEERVSVRISETDKRPDKPTVKAPFDLKSVIGEDRARAGFTAGTGSTAIRADVLQWSLK
jgi:hypothetical protein